MMDSTRVASRDLEVRVARRYLGETDVYLALFRFGGEPVGRALPVPLLGADSMLTEYLSMDPSRIADLHRPAVLTSGHARDGARSRGWAGMPVRPGGVTTHRERGLPGPRDVARGGEPVGWEEHVVRLKRVDRPCSRTLGGVRASGDGGGQQCGRDRLQEFAVNTTVWTGGRLEIPGLRRRGAVGRWSFSLETCRRAPSMGRETGLGDNLACRTA
jgi:hypothetical protein